MTVRYSKCQDCGEIVNVDSKRCRVCSRAFQGKRMGEANKGQKRPDRVTPYVSRIPNIKKCWQCRGPATWREWRPSGPKGRDQWWGWCDQHKRVLFASFYPQEVAWRKLSFDKVAA